MAAEKTVAKKKKIVRRTTTPVLDDPATKSKIFTCFCCGEKHMGTSEFFKNKWSKLWALNDGVVPLCNKCAKDIFEYYAKEYDTKKATMIMCAAYDIPYIATLYTAVAEKSRTNIMGRYNRALMMAQYHKMTFANTIISGEIEKSDEFAREERESKWTRKDIKNKNYVISSIGYDPYDDDSFDIDDRRFLFNTLSGYLTDDILDDPHQTQSVINLVQVMLQRSKIDRLVNQELSSNRTPGNQLKTYVESKKVFDDTINKIASENGISVKSAGKASRNTSTLTGIMREMIANNFEDAKVNIADVKMQGAFRQIAEISSQAIFDQLNLQQDDYARMVATQREMIHKYEEDQVRLEEEIRLLKIKVKELGGDKKGRKS